MAIQWERGFLQHCVTSEVDGWICREWNRALACPEHSIQDAKRLELLDKYGHLLNPITKVSFTPNTVKICQKIIVFKALEEFKGEKAAQEIVSGILKILKIGLLHGDLCASNIGFDMRGNLLIFDWEPFLKIQIRSVPSTELRSSKFAIHPADLQESIITSRSDIFAIGILLLQALYGRYHGLKLSSRHYYYLSSISEKINSPLDAVRSLVSFARNKKSLGIRNNHISN